MRYKAILFDNDDTLMDFQTGNRNAVNRLMDELGYLHPDRYDQYEEINKACWAALERGEMTQGQLRVERFVRFFDAYSLPGDPVRAAERQADRFQAPPSMYRRLSGRSRSGCPLRLSQTALHPFRRAGSAVRR